MRGLDRSTAYLDEVCAQVRWKRAHPLIKQELGDHLEDAREAFVAKGLEDDSAEEMALREMGVARLVGTGLDRSYRPRPAWGILLLAVGMLAFGWVARMWSLIGSQSFYAAQIIPDTLCVVLAAAALVVSYFADYTLLAKNPPALYGIYLLLLVITAPSQDRILALLDTGAVFTSPVNYHYYLQLFLPVIFAALLWWLPERGWRGLMAMCVALAAAMAVGQRSFWMFAGVLYGAVCWCMLLAELLRGRFRVHKAFGAGILGAMAAVTAMWVEIGASFSQWVSMLTHPEQNPGGLGAHALSNRAMLSSAKLVGASSIPWQDVYRANDGKQGTLLTFLVHQAGWVVLAAVIALFASLVAMAIRRIFRLPGRLGRAVTAAVTATLAVQCIFFVLNSLLGLTFSVAPLPLLSHGNLSLIFNAFLIGLMLSVFRREDIARDPERKALRGRRAERRTTAA